MPIPRYIRKIYRQHDGQLRITIPKAYCEMLPLTGTDYMAISMTSAGQLLLERIEPPREIVLVREVQP